MLVLNSVLSVYHQDSLKSPQSYYNILPLIHVSIDLTFFHRDLFFDCLVEITNNKTDPIS